MPTKLRQGVEQVIAAAVSPPRPAALMRFPAVHQRFQCDAQAVKSAPATQTSELNQELSGANPAFFF